MTSLTQHSAAPVRMERLALPATDGYPLSAYRYHAPGHAHGNLLVAGATGVAQRLYRVSPNTPRARASTYSPWTIAASANPRRQA